MIAFKQIEYSAMRCRLFCRIIGNVKSTTAPATVGYDESFKKSLGILSGKTKDEEDYESGNLPFCSRLILGGRIENFF